MNLFGLMETSGSAMQAERMRAEVVAANMANAETTRTATGGPYHRQHVVFAANRADAASSAGCRSGCRCAGRCFGRLHAGVRAGSAALRWAAGTRRAAGGVHIAQVVEDPAPPLKRYDPGPSRCRPGWVCLVSGH